MEENRLIHFFKNQSGKLVIILLALALVGSWGEKKFKRNKNQSRQDFAIACQVYEQFKKGKPLPEELIESTENIVTRHPELGAKYHSLLALTFLSQQNAAKSEIYAKALFKNGEALLPDYYKEFGATSFLISEERYAEAYQAALALETKMGNTEDKYNMLQAFNTLRLFFLADKLHEQKQKNSAWDKLIKLPSFPAIHALFQEGALSLSNYAAYEGV